MAMQVVPTVHEASVLESKTSVSTILVDDDGLVRVTYDEGAVLTLGEANEEIDHVTKLRERKVAQEGPGWPVRILVDIRSIRKASREVKALFGSAEFSNRLQVTGVALVGKSSVSKMRANAFLAWSLPPHPTRLFTCEKSAETWLKELPPRDVSGRD